MTIASRIKKIRELRGWKQISIAAEMHITQQAYSCIEQGANNAKLDTLKRFCNIMQVELPFLIAIDIPVNEENLKQFGTLKYQEFIKDYRKLKQRLEVLEEMFTKNYDNTQTIQMRTWGTAA